MNQKNKRRKSESQATWRSRYQGWLASGLRQSDYCKREGIHAGTFYNWCSHFRKEHVGSQVVSPREEPEFVPVEVSTAQQQPGSRFSLQCGAITIRYSDAPSTEQLSQWVKVLRSSAC